MHVKKKFYYKPMLCRKVKTILVIMGICCFPMISWAQVFLSGRIVDKKTNEPVVGASVYIRKNQVGDNANDNGLYRIKLPQNGTYLVEVSFIGYKTIKQSVTVNRNTTKNFFLEESTEVLNEVVVKASSQQAEINHIRKSPMAVTVVDGAKLRGRSTGIEEVLTRTSGIKVRKSGGLGSSSKMSIHGLEGKRVAIYIDGFPLNSPDGSFDINDIPIDAIKYIEIYKGIVPAEYGSDGLGGAINVVTREDECDLVGFTQEFASFGTSKTLVSVKKMFEKPGIQIGGGFFHNKSDNNYKMTYPVFETNLPSSAYQEVIRNNDYYRSTMYNVGLTYYSTEMARNPYLDYTTLGIVIILTVVMLILLIGVYYQFTFMVSYLIKNAYIGLFISLFVIVGLYFLSPLGSLNMINIINPLTYRDPTMIITGTSSFPYSIGMIVLLIYNVLLFVLNRKVFNENYYE